MRFEPLG